MKTSMQETVCLSQYNSHSWVRSNHLRLKTERQNAGCVELKYQRLKQSDLSACVGLKLPLSPL
jgi:hypothetical protein